MSSGAKTKGFTLIEVVAALAIAAIALLALLQFQLVSIRTADKAQVMTRAVFLAQEKMAEALSGGYPQVGVQSGIVDIEGSGLTWQMEVTDVPLPQLRGDSFQPLGSKAQMTSLRARDRMRRLSVDVAWQTGPGDKHIRLTTYVAQDGIRGV
jgi:type II secretion system protein I